MILTVTLNTSVDQFYLVEAFAPNTVMRVKQVSNTAGGKGLNVSRVAALEGERVVATGFVGGYNGCRFESLICEEGIEKRFTQIASETRCCVNVYDAATRKNTELLEPGNPVCAEELDSFLLEYQAQLQAARVVTISGSLPQGVPMGFYHTLVRMAREADKPVLLDTGGEALRLALDAHPTFIKPNIDELCQLLGRRPDTQAKLMQAAQQLRRDGVEVVAVSLGKEGVLVAHTDGTYRGMTPDLPVVNTVGCGDSMVAGFAIGWLRQMPPIEQIRYAVAISTANALTQQTGSFDPDDLENLLTQIQVERIGD